MNLKVDFCTHDAARYAVTHWHYSRRLPAGKMVKIGAWEEERFIGVVLFSLGACPSIAQCFRLEQTQVCELTRVALTLHASPTSQIVAKAIKLLKQTNPGLKLIVSYADGNQNHLGILYQATNWVYIGQYANEIGFKIHGRITHRRTINSRYGTASIDWLKKHVDPKVEVVKGKYKYKYIFPLDRQSRKLIAPLTLPYPKEIK